VTRCRRLCAVLVAAAAAAASSAAAHSSAGQPYETLRIVERLGDGARVSLRARWPAGVRLPDPTVAGVRVRFIVTPGDGPPRVLALPAAGWTADRHFRYAANGCNGRTVRARLRAGRGGGRFSLDLPDCTTPLLGPGTSSVAILVTSRDVRWCADVTVLEARGRRMSGRIDAPLATCPCEPLPADTLDAIEQRIFERHGCAVSGCHGGSDGQADLLLAPGLSYASLVAVPSIMDPPRLRVAPGDPEESVLWQKLAVRTLGLTGVPGLGMPIGDPPADVDELEAVRLWIAAGAPETGAVAAAQALLDCRP
jgi:hypothetical protein